MVDPYTVALTSCGRFDLLECTLESMFPCLEETPPTKVLIIEDSGDRSVHDVVNRFTYKTGVEIETIVNEQKLGQFRSIDRLYSHVETEWIFHCEDDWEFVENGFIAKSFAILKEFDSCSTVSLLTPDSFGTPNCFLPAAKADCGISYHVADARSGWRFVGLHFNPGLRRMRDYRIVGPYAELGRNIGESKIARAYQMLGYRVICLSRQFVRHIGGGRQIYVANRNPTRFDRIKREIVRPIKRGYCKLNLKANPYTLVKQRFETERPSLSRWRDWDDSTTKRLARVLCNDR